MVLFIQDLNYDAKVFMDSKTQLNEVSGGRHAEGYATPKHDL